MRTWDTAVKNALRAYVNRDAYVYLYGAKNVLLKDRATVEMYMNLEPAYFSKYTNEEKEQIIRNSIGRIGIDCSAFTGWICTGDLQYSTGQKNNSVPNKSICDGVAGSILYTTFGGAGRHIGIDIGYGYCLHTGWESTDENIRKKRDSIVLQYMHNHSIDWEYSGKSNVIDYTGADNR